MDQDTKKEFGNVKKEFTKVKKDIKDIKKSLKTFATKKDLERLATKEDLNILVKNSLKYFVTRPEFEEYKIWAEETFLTKEYFDKYAPLIENIWEVVKENQYEREVYADRYDRLDLKVFDHDRRIKVLEKKN